MYKKLDVKLFLVIILFSENETNSDK